MDGAHNLLKGSMELMGGLKMFNSELLDDYSPAVKKLK